MSGGEWVRLPNGNYRFFTDQELAEMNAAYCRENKYVAYVAASIGAIIGISFGSCLIYCCIDSGELVGYILFGPLGLFFLSIGIWSFKSFYPEILTTFFVTLFVVAFGIWGISSLIFGKSSKEEKQKQEQTENASSSEEESDVYVMPEADRYQWDD